MDKVSTSQDRPLPEDVASRVQRYAQLRCAQRALYPVRPLPGRLPAEENLQKVRSRLRELAEGFDSGPGCGTPTRQATLADVDRMLQEVARDLRAIAGSTSFSELRATLPQVRATRPREVAALLDLCLGDDESIPSLFNLIEYLVTLMAAGDAGGERILGVDPVSVTRRLREVCEEFTGFDPMEIRTHVGVLEQAIVELRQSDSVEDVIPRVREYKARIGRAMFVPDLLRKIVEYNVTVSNRLEDALEAERVLHEIELYTAASPKGPWSSSEDGEPATETDPSTARAAGIAEQREQSAMLEIADAIARRVSGDESDDRPASQVVRALDLSLLSPWERLAFSAGIKGPEPDLLRSVVVVGLMLRGTREVDEPLALIGLGRESLETTWAPRLDGQLQKAIAAKLAGNAYAEAKHLSQTRAKFLFRSLEASRRAGAAPRAPTAVRSGARVEQRRFLRRLALPSRPDRGARGVSASRRAESFGWAQWLGLALALGALLTVGGAQLYMSMETEPVRPVPSLVLAELSPYLEAAYRDGFGEGIGFFGTFGDAWEGLPEDARRAEALRLGNRLRRVGVEQIVIFGHSNLHEHVGDAKGLLDELSEKWRRLTIPARRSAALRLGNELRRAGAEQVMLFNREDGLRLHYMGEALLHPQPPGL